MNQAIDELKSAGIVQDSSSPYSSKPLVAKKKRGKGRLCIDYGALNRVTRRDCYPFPLIEDQLDGQQGKSFFATLNLASGYRQVPVAKTAFVTAGGHYEFLRMSFGLTNAPVVFQRMTNVVLGPLRYGVLSAYMNDALIPSKGFDEGLKHLERSPRAPKRKQRALIA